MAACAALLAALQGSFARSLSLRAPARAQASFSQAGGADRGGTPDSPAGQVRRHHHRRHHRVVVAADWSPLPDLPTRVPAAGAYAGPAVPRLIEHPPAA